MCTDIRVYNFESHVSVHKETQLFHFICRFPFCANQSFFPWIVLCVVVHEEEKCPPTVKESHVTNGNKIIISMPNGVPMKPYAGINNCISQVFKNGSNIHITASACSIATCMLTILEYTFQMSMLEKTKDTSKAKTLIFTSINEHN